MGYQESASVSITGRGLIVGSLCCWIRFLSTGVYGGGQQPAPRAMTHSTTLPAKLTPQARIGGADRRLALPWQLARVAVSFECVFALYMFAGTFKTNVDLYWVQIDLTLLLLLTNIAQAIQIVTRRGYRVAANGLAIMTLGCLFLVYATVSMVWSPSVEYAQYKIMRLCTLNLWCLFSTTLIISRERVRFQRFLIVQFLLAVCLAWSTHSKYLVRGETFDAARAGANYISIGNVLGLGCLVAFSYFLFFARNAVQRALALLALLALVAVFLRLGARGPLVATSISLLVCLLLQIRLGKSRARFSRRWKSGQLYAVLALTLTLGSVAGYMSYTGNVPRTIQRLQLLFDGGGGYAFGRSAGVRVEYYYSAYLIWFDHPAYGGGIGSYPVKLGKADARTYPHNLILEIMAELGTIGLLLFLAMLISAFRNLGGWSTIQNDPLRVIALMFVVSSLIGTMFSGDLVDNRTVFGTIGFLGLAPAGRGCPPASHGRVAHR